MIHSFTLFYKFRESTCNDNDDVQFCKQVIGNKPECMDNLLVMYNKHAKCKKLHIFIVVRVLFDLFACFVQCIRGNLIAWDVYCNSYETAVQL